jgi:soluble lytic murein transglycosylase-like protein
LAIASLGLALSLCACSSAGLQGLVGTTRASAGLSTAPYADASGAPLRSAGALDALIVRYAALNGVPPALVHRVIQRESGYNPKARNGPYWGLMQIRHDTAVSMGYRGSAAGLLDAETNLKYGVKYLAGAWLVANRNSDQAVRNYARGYYYKAKRMGLLEETGLRLN